MFQNAGLWGRTQQPVTGLPSIVKPQPKKMFISALVFCFWADWKTSCIIKQNNNLAPTSCTSYLPEHRGSCLSPHGLYDTVTVYVQHNGCALFTGSSANHIIIIIIITLSSSWWARYVQDKSCLSRAACLGHPYKAYWYDSVDNHVM